MVDPLVRESIKFEDDFLFKMFKNFTVETKDFCESFSPKSVKPLILIAFPFNFDLISVKHVKKTEFGS